MEIGDTMDDFVMSGYTDSNKDGSLAGEKLAEVRLSDFAKTHKIILFDISAGWCGPCKTETTWFAGWLKTYGSKGLMIFQTLSDGNTQGSTPTTTMLDSWISTYKAVGACGIDPYKQSSQYNSKGTVPLNLIIDAKTLKVLDKINGASKSALEAKIKTHLGL